MAATNAIAGIGGKLEYGDQSTHGASTVWTEVSEVITWDNPGEEVGSIDVSHLQSPSSRREFITGLIDPGEIDFTLNHTTAQYNTLLNTLLNVQRGWRITLSDAAVLAFTATLVQLGQNVPVDSQVTNPCRLRTTSTPTFTT